MGNAALLTIEVKNGPRISVRSPKAIDRLRSMPETFDRSRCGIRIDGRVPTAASLIGVPVVIREEGEEAGVIEGQPIFFDQTDYMFELLFPEGTSEARLFSPIATWCERSDWNPEVRSLHLPVNFGNDLGDFELMFEWHDDDADIGRSLSVRGRVFSTKLDVGRHVPDMMKDVQQRFDWMRLDIFRSTLWNWSRDDRRDGNLQTWLAVFREVRVDLSSAFRELIRRHRRRLTSTEYGVRADQIRKIRPRSEEHAAEKMKDRPNTRFVVTRKHLDVDTPENRYMRHLLTSCLRTLTETSERIAPINRISDAFKDRLREWEDEWSKLSLNPFWRGIGPFHGLRKESLILSQDPLYARIRRSWIHLQHGVSLLDCELRGGLQNVAQLYEIWCLVQLDRFVSQHDDWTNDERCSIPLDLEDDDFESDEWRAGTVKLSYSHARITGVRLELLFQPTAGRRPDHRYWDGMMSLPEQQCPDLVFRIHRGDLPGTPVFTWIFDAKYRIAVDKNNLRARAPRDAIDAMHRYRDAILWAADSQGEGRLTRESLGAFVLYPGEEDTSSPQLESVGKVNIGAFTIRPGTNTSHSSAIRGSALGEKLNDLLSIVPFDVDRPWRLGETHRHYDATPRVRQSGGEETLRCAIRSDMESESYWKTCRLYRLPIEREADVYKPARSWGWIVPTGSDGTPYGRFRIRESATLRRNEIVRIYQDQDIPIADDPLKADRLYRLFWLDEPIPVPMSERRKLPPGRIVDYDPDANDPGE